MNLTKLFKVYLLTCLGDAFNPDCPDLDIMDECFTECSNNAVGCLIKCDGDSECISQCNRDKHTCDMACPCVSDECYNGCDSCSHSLCLNSVMILKYIPDSSSWQNYIFNNRTKGFSQLELESDVGSSYRHSCSVTFQDRFLILGGNINKRQVSVVDYCQINWIANMKHDFNDGSCGVFKYPDDKVFLCFPNTENGYSKCWSYGGYHENEELPFENLSTDHSQAGNNLGNYGGSPFVIGGGNGTHSLDTNRAETLNLTTNTWSRKEDFPFSQRIRRHITVSFEDYIFVFGGIIGTTNLDIVARFMNDKWYEAGSMKESRASHNGIALNHLAYLVGGWGDKKVEIWDVWRDDNSDHQPLLNDGDGAIALFNVRQNYCYNMTITN